MSQTCVVSSGSGSAAANVTNVSVACTTNTFPVGGTVSGLFGTGLVLENNGGNPLAVAANGAIAFSTNVASGAAYNVAVRTQPTGTPPQTCTVSTGAGTVDNGPITNVAVQCRAQAGRFAYVAAAAPNGIAAFTIDANTGALTPMTGSPFATAGQAPRVLITDPAGKFLYVYGDDNTAAAGGTTLTGFTVDLQTGALQPIPGLLVNFAASPGPVAFHPNGGFFYVPVTESVVGPNNRLRGFAVNATTGGLSEVPGSPYAATADEVINSVVLSPDGANLYLASSTPFVPGAPATPPTGRITRYAVGAPTGQLTATAPQVTVANNSFNGLFMHPAGTHFYTRNSASPALTPLYASRFTIDALTGAVGAKLDIATAFGFGLVIAPGSRVYFPEFGGTFGAPQAGSVAGYVDVPSGGIGPFPGSPYLTGGTNSLAPVLDPTGRFLALTNLGSGNVTLMRIDPAQGSLAHVAGSPYVPSVGTQPGSVTYDPSGRFAFLTDAAGSISSYTIDVSTGAPTFVSSQPTGGSPGLTPVTILGRQ